MNPSRSDYCDTFHADFMEHVKCYYFRWPNVCVCAGDPPRAHGLLWYADTRLQRDTHLRLLEVLTGSSVHHQHTDTGILHHLEQSLGADASWRERETTLTHTHKKGVWENLRVCVCVWRTVPLSHPVLLLLGSSLTWRETHKGKINY